MLQLTPQMRILVAIEPVDFRNGIDGLVRLCKEALGQDPFQGIVFAFRNRRGTAVKVLMYDGQGYWLCHKRLSEGRFRWWPAGADSVPKRWPRISCRSCCVRAIPRGRKPRRIGVPWHPPDLWRSHAPAHTCRLVLPPSADS